MSSSPILPFAMAKAYTDKKISEIEQGGGTGSGAVDSVNNKTGDVSLDADDILLDDSAQNSKSIAEAINDLNTAVQDVVVVSDSQPSGSGNELWIKPTGSQSIQVPTTEEFTSAIGDVSRALNALEPAATAADVGKFLKAKTVEGGKVTEYELEEAGLPEGLPTEETAQELLAQETYNTGLTDSMLAVIGAIFNGLPQDEPATDILNSLSLECERLQAIYENWMSERSA